MSMHPKGRINKPKQTEMRVDLKQAETLQCEKCTNYLFITSFVLKRISALMSPNGQEGIVPVQVYSCGNCGAVPSSLLEGTDITGKELGEETDS
tara:strand:- start:1278 stop:1559 length:282 start_codon:yes stop_codon:yes gene_type:complete